MRLSYLKLKIAVNYLTLTHGDSIFQGKNYLDQNTKQADDTIMKLTNTSKYPTAAIRVLLRLPESVVDVPDLRRQVLRALVLAQKGRWFRDLWQLSPSHSRMPGTQHLPDEQYERSTERYLDQNTK